MKSRAALLDPDETGVCPLNTPMPEVAHGIVSQAVLTAPGLRLTLFHFTAGQELSEHATPARALVQVLAGSCAFTISGKNHALKAGALLHMPPKVPHAVRATADLTLLITQVS